MNAIGANQIEILRGAYLAGLSIRRAAALAHVNKITANTYFIQWRNAPLPREAWDGTQRARLTFPQACDAMFYGWRCKRACWDTYVFGSRFGQLGLTEDDIAHEKLENVMWFDLPELCTVTGCELLPGIIGSEYEDDSYEPTDADMRAKDWEVER